jgi:hypothetical protein
VLIIGLTGFGRHWLQMMQMTPSVAFLTKSDDSELLRSLQKHLAMLEEQLASLIKQASQLPTSQQDQYWSLAADLQKEIRLTRKQIAQQTP